MDFWASASFFMAYWYSKACLVTWEEADKGKCVRHAPLSQGKQSRRHCSVSYLLMAIWFLSGSPRYTPPPCVGAL
jgi:hypothetical protein